MGFAWTMFSPVEMRNGTVLIHWCRRLTFKTQVVPSGVDGGLPEAGNPGSGAAVASHTQQWHGNGPGATFEAAKDAAHNDKGKTRLCK